MVVCKTSGKDTKKGLKRILHLHSNYLIKMDNYSLIVLVIFSVACFFHLLFQLVFILPLIIKSRKKTSVEKPKNEAISVIIVAKNEAVNLQKNLEEILRQQYDKFEVIVVNDHSNDNSIEILEGFQKFYPQLKIVDFQDWNTGGKKASLSRGIFHAENDILLFTDADCKVVSDKWIESIANCYTDKTEIVIAYGAYQRLFSVLNSLIRFDAAIIGLYSLGFANAKLPYMGVGRNLSYRRSLFLKNKGFIRHLHLQSGDDDLFVQEAATKANTVICLDKRAKTISEPKKNWMGWYKQKKRHQSTANYYKSKFKILLSFQFLVKMIVFLSWPLAFFISFQNEMLIELAIVVLIQIIIFSQAFKVLDEKGLTIWVPFLEILMILNTFIIAIYSFFYRDNQWK